MRKNTGWNLPVCRRSNTIRRSEEHETACGHNSGDTHSIGSRRGKGRTRRKGRNGSNLSGKRTGTVEMATLSYSSSAYKYCRPCGNFQRPVILWRVQIRMRGVRDERISWTGWQRITETPARKGIQKKLLSTKICRRKELVNYGLESD